MLDGMIIFRPVERQRDAEGVYREQTSTEREVFARVKSASRSEFFDGGQAGFKPEYQFTVFCDEYQGESECEYEGIIYSIYRTYQVPGTDDLELYVQRKVGTTSGA